MATYTSRLRCERWPLEEPHTSGDGHWGAVLGAGVERFDDPRLGNAVLGGRKQPAGADAVREVVSLAGELVSRRHFFNADLLTAVHEDPPRVCVHPDAFNMDAPLRSDDFVVMSDAVPQTRRRSADV